MLLAVPIRSLTRRSKMFTLEGLRMRLGFVGIFVVLAYWSGLCYLLTQWGTGNATGEFGSWIHLLGMGAFLIWNGTSAYMFWLMDKGKDTSFFALVNISLFVLIALTLGVGQIIDFSEFELEKVLITLLLLYLPVVNIFELWFSNRKWLK